MGTVRNWDPYDKYNYVDQIAIAYDRDFDLALDGVVDGDVIDLNAVVTEFLGEDTQGWSLAEAFAINGSDQIVGRATRQFPGQAEESRGFVTYATWTQCYLLPWPSGRSGQIAKRINSTGVVVAQEGDDYSETMSKFATNGQVTVYTWDGSADGPAGEVERAVTRPLHRRQEGPPAQVVAPATSRLSSNELRKDARRRRRLRWRIA